MLDGSRSRSRRAFLGGGLGGLLALVAAALGRPAPVRAEGEVMRVGGDHLTATTATQLKNSTTGNDVMILTTTQPFARALYAKSSTGAAIDARSTGVVAISASTTDPGGSGVIGTNSYQGTRGVLGHWAAGVVGNGANGGTAVWGLSAGGTGLRGDGPAGGYGVHGSSPDGIGVRADSFGDGLALRVIGRASFTRSGVATIAGGTDRVHVSVGPLGVSASSLVLATLQEFRQGRYIASATPKPADSKVTIRLNGIVATDTKVAWQVLDLP